MKVVGVSGQILLEKWMGGLGLKNTPLLRQQDICPVIMIKNKLKFEQLLHGRKKRVNVKMSLIDM